MAGHETTANTLTWAWYLLAQHPEAEARLHAELDQVLGDRIPTLADLPRLSFTEHVITEALRVYPTVWLLGREAIVPTVVGGVSRAGWDDGLYESMWWCTATLGSSRIRESFRPERWQDGLMKRIPRYAYFPFGGGPRLCIGNSFAMMESVLLLATIARQFRLGLALGTKAKLAAR